MASPSWEVPTPEATWVLYSPSSALIRRRHGRTTATYQEWKNRVKPLAAMLPGPQRASVWAWREVSIMCVYPLTIKASLAACTWAVGRWTLGKGSSLLGSFTMSTIMAASGESR